jgi:predicted TIM-barrel fold metal-dependent hydrolase
MTLHYFDAFTLRGPRRAKHAAQGWRLEDILADLQQCSIAGALVADTMSINYDPMWGNLRLSDALAPHPNLFPIWNVMPHHTGEFPPPEALPTLLREHGVRAIMLNHAANGWDLHSPIHHPLLAMLERERILTILRDDQIGGFHLLEALLDRFPGLPVLIPNAHWISQRVYFPLLQTYKNLHIGTSHFQAHYGYERLVDLGCEDQVLFTSNSPEMSVGAHRTALDYADISATAQEKIAGGNLTRLLGQAPPPVEINPDEDCFMRATRCGEPQPAPVVDFHVHILHEGLHGAGGVCAMYDGGPSGAVRLLLRLGCETAGVMGWPLHFDAVTCTDAARLALDVFPEGCWGLGTFDPSHFSTEEMLAQMEAVYADPRFLGVKPYIVFGLRYDDPRYAPMWEFANARGLYALIHRSSDLDFSEINNLAPLYPNIAFVAAHTGASFAVADQAIASMQAHPNVYAELTYTPVTAGVVEYLVRAVGAERILYGSDLPMRDPRQQLGWVVYAKISEAEKRLILGENALRIVAACRAKRATVAP